MKLFDNLKNLQDFAPVSDSPTPDEVDYINDTLHLDEASDDDLYNYKMMMLTIWTHRYKLYNDDAKFTKGVTAESYRKKASSTWNAMMVLEKTIELEMSNRS